MTEWVKCEFHANGKSGDNYGIDLIVWLPEVPQPGDCFYGMAEYIEYYEVVTIESVSVNKREAVLGCHAHFVERPLPVSFHPLENINAN